MKDIPEEDMQFLLVNSDHFVPVDLLFKRFPVAPLTIRPSSFGGVGEGRYV